MGEQDDESVSLLTIGCWNVGGMFLNHPRIFDSCKDVDISCFVETFLENDTAPHLRIPNDSHALFIPGKRGPHSHRASGGFALLNKNNVARPENCSFVESANGICVATLRLENSAELSVIVVYRADKAGTPLHNLNFFTDLDAAIASCEDRETLILGDFNTKLGDRRGALGLLDFAEDLLPAVAESTDVDPHAEELFQDDDCSPGDDPTAFTGACLASSTAAMRRQSKRPSALVLPAAAAGTGLRCPRVRRRRW